ncbi:Saccharopine dehydrogenase-domain-containing protein [Suillus placidus]|uniref:Saccharopine dehydrogenase-domain-containing protein n=1 Tax=Suillus placidus TaxID=48579 RepID=A0A9P7A398_9AGAM|nr:Saccharopine dehydrogenase-domain-containing protein [Suillus placidus]
MIAHLPLASHPNPKKVLVIGGGDGGVEVVLCDIDEAVIRVSKRYLLHMSVLLDSPRVKVFVGDGFKFLAENEATCDDALFQKPYFKLLHDALTPGGHISTQAESQWLHISLIGNLLKSTRELFIVSQYAFTTIPTYPSGQIGFMVCSKEQGRDLRVSVPARKVTNTRYYNENVHRAAFVLPQFAQSFLEDGKDILPVFGCAAAAAKVVAEGKKVHKVLLLSSGFVARPCAEYVVRDPSNELTIACRTLQSAQALVEGLPNAQGISLDVNNTSDLEAQVAAHDLVISLIPYTYHVTVIKAAIKAIVHIVTTSYVSPAMRELDEEAKRAGIIVMNEIGLDPGIDHLYTIKTIDEPEVHAKGGKVKQFLSYCGGLPAPECSGNPLGYKFSWSSRGVLLALLNSASYLSESKQLDISDNELTGYAKPYFISPAFAFVAYPNRNSVPFREWYNILEAETVVRGTLRYQGFHDFIKALVELGWLDASEKDWLKEGLTWAQVMQQAISANDAAEKVHNLLDKSSTLVAHVKSPRAGNLLDTLCAQLETLMKYEQGKRDLVMLQHKFMVEWADGSEQMLTLTLEQYGSPSGHSAMAYKSNNLYLLGPGMDGLHGLYFQVGVSQPVARPIY